MKRFILLMPLFISCLPEWYEDESFLAGTWNIGAIEYTISDCSSEYFYKYDDFGRYEGTVHFYLHEDLFSEEIIVNYSFQELCENSGGSIDGNKCVINDSTFFNAELCEANEGKFQNSSSSCNITFTSTQNFSIPNDINMNDRGGSKFCVWDFNDEENTQCGKIYIKSNGNNGAVKMVSIALSTSSPHDVISNFDSFGCRYMLLVK